MKPPGFVYTAALLELINAILYNKRVKEKKP